MEEALQHETTTQRIGLSPASPGNHPSDGPKTGDALTFKMDHSSGADHGGLDDHTVERMSLATVHHLLQLEQRGSHIAGRCAAKATCRRDDITLGALVNEIVIERDRAELVNDDGRMPHPPVRQHLVEQRCLAGTEKSGQ